MNHVNRLNRLRFIVKIYREKSRTSKHLMIKIASLKFANSDSLRVKHAFLSSSLTVIKLLFALFNIEAFHTYKIL